ncbi:MAG: calcium/sodium antiporter [Bernardetiaceae bacterium]
MPEWLESLLIILVTFYVMSEVVESHFLDSLDNISNWLKLPPDVAGATLLALGTSAPEISTSLLALFLGENANPAMGVGTIVGSAVFQMLVVIGFAAVVRTCVLDWRPLLRDSIAYTISIGLLLWFMYDGKFTLLESIGFVVAYGLYLFMLFFWTRRANAAMRVAQKNQVQVYATPDELAEASKEETNPSTAPRTPLEQATYYFTWPIKTIFSIIPDTKRNPRWTVPVFFISLAIIAYACYWMVLAAEIFAQGIGIPTAIIALTILAGGSSVPEMISSAVVSKQGKGDMAISNAVGSNIFDILMSLGLPLLIYTIIHGEIDLAAQLAAQGQTINNITYSVVLLFGTVVLVVGLLAILRFRANRYFGWLLIALYVLYVVAAYAGWLE